MYPYAWTWIYTIIVFVALFSLFVAGAVLIWRRGPRRMHRTPQSISTPLGYLPIWDKETQRMVAPGVQRARARQYHVKGREE